MPDSDESREFRERLPEGCPPPEAQEIITEQVVFRLVRRDPPTDSDFQSQRAEKLNRRFTGVSECQARGLSVFSDMSEAAKRLKLPALKGRLICQVTLDRESGYILRTGSLGHFTWWPFARFPILSKCQVVRR